MVSTRRKTYASVAPIVRTTTKTLLVEAAEVGTSFNDTNEPAIFAAEGELPYGSAPAADQNALSVYSPPRIRRSDLEEYLEWFQGRNNEEDESKDRVRAESPFTESSDEGSSVSSPYGWSAGSPMAGSVSSPSQAGSVSSPVAGSVSSPLMVGSAGSPLKVDGDFDEGVFLWPRITAKNRYNWSAALNVENKFFPTWFDLSMDEDQLGPIPDEWKTGDGTANSQEDEDLSEAIRRSLADHTEQISSMAVIVEVEEEPVQNIKTDLEVKKAAASKATPSEPTNGGATGKASGAKPKKVRSEKDKPESARKDGGGKGPETKGPASKANYMRASSQVPEGGWFRATTSGGGDPPGPNSSSESDSSSSSSDSSYKARRRKRENKKKATRRKDERTQMKKAMSGIKIKPPFVWDAKPNLDVFDHWTYEVDTWIELTGLTDKLALKLMVNFMGGTASKFFMDHVATDQKQWTVKEVYKALFDYCFPADFKLRLRRRLMNAYQGKNTVRDFVREIRALAKRFPDVTERHLVQILWDGVQQYLRVKWLDRGMSPEESSLDKLVKWAVRFEKSKEAMDREERDWKPKPTGNTWGRFQNRTRGNEPWKPVVRETDPEGAKNTHRKKQKLSAPANAP
ncbi:hypothetical protein C8R44DRAFT_992383 [Mycena epipterygia]|nr:hypothetical protein C8R44DRAFT_992383 [Mycena epipterygia]